MTVQQALHQSALEICQKAEAHRELLARNEEGGDASTDRCPLVDCPHRRTLRRVVAETVAVLEETRKSFKSKRLEALRKELIGVLAEDA
jgi:hypothetical protein